MQIDFCDSCGRVVLKGFNFCPYCGATLGSGEAFEAAVHGPFVRLSAMQSSIRGRRIQEMLEDLEVLEAEVEQILNGYAAST
ncbi:MAG: zinc-ribbon domain-containing protein [Clostridia bacterium]|jgi:hypothetical protein|nr:zinc-ribbon domain-containing protein [Spirochaetia bacterium]